MARIPVEICKQQRKDGKNAHPPMALSEYSNACSKFGVSVS